MKFILTACLFFLYMISVPAQWESQNSGVSVPLRGVYFLDSQTGIFTGDNSTVLKTTNGGDVWTTQTLPVTGLFIEDAHIFDELNAIVVGDKVFKTTNGGAQWNEVTIPGSPALSGVHFVNSSLGFASSAGGKIYITTDSGSNWTQQTSNTTAFLTDISFANSTIGYAVGFGGTIVYTSDGGTNWNPASTGTTNNLWGVFAVTPTLGYAVGGDGSALNGNILKTTDGGANWNSSIVDPNSLLTGIYFINPDTGYVSGTKIWKTEDGGQTWVMQKDISETTVIFFSDSLTGYAGDHAGNIYKTINGGTSGIKDESNLVESYQLFQNYPNPFNPSTKIKYTIPSVISTGERNLFVTLKVYDVLGNEVATLVNEEKPAGAYEVVFNAENLPSGIYFYRLVSGKYTETKKMILLR
jgi:photosystem II stability/assembly factor-like uncharacterized protein